MKIQTLYDILMLVCATIFVVSLGFICGLVDEVVSVGLFTDTGTAFLAWFIIGTVSGGILISNLNDFKKD